MARRKPTLRQRILVTPLASAAKLILYGRFCDLQVAIHRIRGGMAFRRPHLEPDVVRLDMTACAEIARGVQADFAPTVSRLPSFQAATAAERPSSHGTGPPQCMREGVATAVQAAKEPPPCR